MKELLLSVEKNLYHAASVIRLVCQADYDNQAVDIEDALELASEIIENEREKITNRLILLQLDCDIIKKAEE